MQRVILTDAALDERPKIQSIPAPGAAGAKANPVAKAADLEYLSLTAYMKTYKVKAKPIEGVDMSRVLGEHGRRLVQLSKRRGQEVRKVPDERWGAVNAYALSILRKYFQSAAE